MNPPQFQIVKPLVDMAAMEKRLMRLFCVMAILLAALPAWAGSNGDSAVRAGTPAGARMISLLEEARHIDQMDAQGYKGSDYADVGTFYYQKSLQVDAILKRLGQGEAVSTDDIQKALDNSGAVRYGGY